VSVPREQAPVFGRHDPAATAESTSPASVPATVESMLLEERTRWAMTIHDGLTQSVTSAILELQVLRHRIETDPGLAVETLREVEEAIRNDLSEIREVLFQLDAGRLPADPAFATFVRELVERWKLPARVTIEGDLDTVPRTVLETAHGVVAESLANAAKHSGSKDVTVRVACEPGALRVEVTDRGRGIAAVTDDDPHFGLRLLHTRVHEIGGSIDVESTPGHGVRVTAVLPVGGESR
jgi:signal transduction histidine kinase